MLSNIKKYLVSVKKSGMRLDRKFSYEMTRYHHQAGESYFGIQSSFDHSEMILSQSEFDRLRLALDRISVKPVNLGKSGIVFKHCNLPSQENAHQGQLDRIIPE